MAVAFSQNYKVVVAQRGDGIFSMLRKQGLDPVKYYGEFIELNKEKLGAESTLVLGESYRIPISTAGDNINVRAQLVRIGDSLEHPLLPDRLSQIKIKGDELAEAVIYLISAHHPEALGELVRQQAREVNLAIAQELVEYGAQVFLIEPYTDSLSIRGSIPLSAWVPSEERIEYSMAPMELMAGYVDEINKRYIKFSGAYQRVILTRLDGPVDRNARIHIMHYKESKDSKLVANQLRELFQRERLKADEPEQDQYTVFKNPDNLYLGRNSLAPVTLVEFRSARPGNARTYRSNRRLFGRVIADGLREDFARLQFEEEE